MKLTIGLVFGFSMAWAQAPMKALNPRVGKIVAEVSAERVGALMKNAGGIRDSQSVFVAGGSEEGDWRGGAMDTG